MRIKRALITPVILALGLAGSILAGSAATAVVAQAGSAHAHPAVASNVPHFLYRG